MKKRDKRVIAKEDNRAKDSTKQARIGRRKGPNGNEQRKRHERPRKTTRRKKKNGRKKGQKQVDNRGEKRGNTTMNKIKRG